MYSFIRSSIQYTCSRMIHFIKRESKLKILLNVIVFNLGSFLAMMSVFLLMHFPSDAIKLLSIIFIFIYSYFFHFYTGNKDVLDIIVDVPTTLAWSMPFYLVPAAYEHAAEAFRNGDVYVLMYLAALLLVIIAANLIRGIDFGYRSIVLYDIELECKEFKRIREQNKANNGEYTPPEFHF